MALPCGCSGMSVDTVIRRASFRTVASSCGLFSLVRLIQRTMYVCRYLPTQPSPAFLLYHALYRVTRREYSLDVAQSRHMALRIRHIHHFGYSLSLTWMYDVRVRYTFITIDNRKYISNSLNPVLCYAMLCYLWYDAINPIPFFLAACNVNVNVRIGTTAQYSAAQ